MHNNPFGHSLDPIEDDKQFPTLIRSIIWTAAPYEGEISVTFPEIPHFQVRDSALTMRFQAVKTPATVRSCLETIDDPNAATLLSALFESVLEHTDMFGYHGDMVIRLHAAKDRPAVTLSRGSSSYYFEFGETPGQYQDTDRYRVIRTHAIE
jgi:hypothetical protein